jgi:carbon monoxide dehydrogenase subunit G
MELKGEYRIPVGREAVWAALNDPAVLQRCIPGCEELERTDEHAFRVAAKAAIGPVKATFKGSLALSDLDPPASYRITGDGKGGPAGFARGGAAVTLTEDGDETVLAYEVDAKVGGKIAQVGQRMIDSAAKKMADDFFAEFVEAVAPGALEAQAETAPEAPAKGRSPLVIGLVAAAALAALVAIVVALAG